VSGRLPLTEVLLYQAADGTIPVVEWLRQLQSRNRPAFEKCLFLLDLLEQFGHELRRPRADDLQDGVYELRTGVRGVNYRMLRGFVGKDVALVACGLTKESEVKIRRLIRPSGGWSDSPRIPTSTEPPRRLLMSKRTTNAIDIIRQETGVDPRTDSGVQAYWQSFEIAQMIYDARTAAGLTQHELADRIGSQQPVISQLENADYEGHSLTMLERIAEALGMNVELRLVPQGRRRS
jgi:DNA-binding XRE family transcriptional regulator